MAYHVKCVMILLACDAAKTLNNRTAVLSFYESNMFPLSIDFIGR